MIDSAMADQITLAYENHIVTVDEADKMNLAFELAQQLTSINELRNVRNV